MAKVFISVPMTGRLEQDIVNDITRAQNLLREKGFEPVDSYRYFNENDLRHTGVEFPDLFMLAQALQSMSTCEGAYFCKGWRQSRGCSLEHDAAFDYGLDIYFEGDL